MIRYIIFDFGGVLINLDVEKTDKIFGEFFNIQLQNRLYPAPFQEYFSSYEKGLISEEYFLSELSRRSSKEISKGQLKEAWNAMILDLPERRLEMLSALQSDFTLILLSNTNFSHIERVRQILTKDNNVESFEEDYFDHVFYSHEIGLAKPGEEIYQYVVENSKITVSEAIFIDDTPANLSAPSKMGIKCFHHNPSIEISNVIWDYIDQANKMN